MPFVFSRVTHGSKHMSDRVAFLEGRTVPRLALTGLAVIWLAGCSADVTRFDASSSPFANPFGSRTAQATPPAGSAPAGQVASAPLAPAASVASAPLPGAAAPATSTAHAVGGSAAGWSAAGGTPVVVANGDTLDTLSRRYGVPSAALLSANGLSSPADVKSGMRIVVPVYNAGGRAVASAPAAAKESAAKTVADSSAKAKKGAEHVAEADDGDTPVKAKKAEDKARKAEDRKAGDKAAEKAKSEPKTPDVKSATKTEPAQVAKAEPAKTDVSRTAAKKGVDNTPTASVDPKAPAAKEPAAPAEADASGSGPEFRWPARGRIIQGFKAGGNDGIDISVPAGTSVRAAENGVVVYSGDGLKGYGNLVLIKHPNGYVTAYANNAELDVKRGEQVKRGQVIAKSGDTGNVNSPQLHFELRKGSTPVDPTSYLAGL